jgi:lipopolysaccharide transport system ATP-binding protein
VPRPPAGAYLDISRAAQVDNGLARCVGVALTDAEGNPCTAFRQGDTAVFTYEFALSGDIGVPICGLVLHNDRGVLVFGKSTWESDGEIDPGLGALPRIRCRQEVRLDLATGEYVFEVGLAAVTPETWRRRAWVAHEESSALVARICHVPRAGVLSVALRMRDGIPVLTHHGVANLPGEIRIGGAEAVAQPAREASAGG